MEVVRVQGSKSKILIKPGQTRELGRAHGFSSSDRTISRRHISFFNPSHNHTEETRLQFEVVGKNPIFVNKDDGVKIFRRFERGEIESGHIFCVSAKNPIWYAVRRVENGGVNVIENVLESELARSLESGSEIVGIEDLQQEGLDFSGVDHVKEFGFVVMGHDFDSYPKKRLRDIKNWDWFLEEPSKGGDDDEEEGRKVRGRGSGRRKRKKGEENDDEDWTGESEDDKELVNKSRKSQNPKYMTRSKNSSKLSKDNKKSKSTTGKQNRNMDEEDMEDEDEDDETLEGFIVDDQNLEDEQIGDEEEDEEEEELEDEYDEDEDE